MFGENYPFKCLIKIATLKKILKNSILELKRLVTRQTSVERLFSGVVKLYWIWHGKNI